MRIGLVSDSHGNMEMLKKAVHQMGEVEAIFHLGDYTEDGLTIRQWTEVPVFIIKGNMDIYDNEGSLFIKTEIGGKKILACHGHTAHVKNNYATLYYKALEEAVDIVIFGHTHIPMIETTEQLLMMNPGSVALPHFNGEKTFGILTIENGKIRGEIIPLIDE
ncbi:MAG: metallophosphoesterase [Eubacterium sp.]